MANEPVRCIALRLLEEILEQGGSSSYLFDRAQFRNASDRAFAMQLVLGSIRRLNALDAVLSQRSKRAMKDLEPSVRNGLRLGVYQLVFMSGVPPHAAVGETVGAVKRASGHGAAGYTNGVLRACIRALPALPTAADPEAYVETTLSLPRFLAARWRQRFGADATRRLAERAVEPPVATLRVITQRSTPAEVLSFLHDDGVETAPGRYLDEAVRVTAGLKQSAAALRDGLVIVQDEAAQLVARLVDPQPGDRVLDACAAPGGKSIALFDLTRGAAQVFAADSHATRMVRARAAFERTQCTVHSLAASADAPPFTQLFDRILIDAPCTGTGTIRKNPEIRYRVDHDSLLRSAARANAIVDALVDLVRPGGRMVYATCSLESEENEQVIERLLARRPDLRRVDPRPSLPAAAHRFVADDWVMRTQPEDVELDGFTAFVLERLR